MNRNPQLLILQNHFHSITKRVSHRKICDLGSPELVNLLYIFRRWILSHDFHFALPCDRERDTASAVHIPSQTPKANLMVPGEALKKDKKGIMQKRWEQISFPSCSSSTLIKGLPEKARRDCFCLLESLSVAHWSVESSTFKNSAVPYNASLFITKSSQRKFWDSPTWEAFPLSLLASLCPYSHI